MQLGIKFSNPVKKLRKKRSELINKKPLNTDGKLKKKQMI